MKRIREIQTNVDDFRKAVISAILFAFPERAVDDSDPSNDSFIIDGVPVRVESDRIVVGDDYSNYIPLKDAPIAGNPPQYRDVDSILVDFEAYVNKEKKGIKESTLDLNKNFILKIFNKVSKNKNLREKIAFGLFIEGGRSINSWGDFEVVDSYGSKIDNNKVYLTTDDDSAPIEIIDIQDLMNELEDLGYSFYESTSSKRGILIEKSIKVPGTDLILEAGDKIYIKSASNIV